MRAAVLYDVDDIRVETRPVPELQPGDLLVATAASGICSGDLMAWYVRRKAPFVFGHEPAGTIVAVGAGGDARDRDGRPFAVGERVFAHHHAPCLACAACARGDYVQCAAWRASHLEPGGMAEFVRVPRANLVDTLRLPAAVDWIDGSLVEPLGCVVKSLARGFGEPAESIGGSNRPLAGAVLYVIGLGVMGLMHVALALAAGARVFAADPIEARRSRALALGAQAAFAPKGAVAQLAGAEPDVVVCGPGSAVALQHATETVRAGGRIVMFTPLDSAERFSFDQSSAYFRDLSLIASYSCGPDDTRAALAAIARGVVSAERLGAARFALDDVASAYAAMRDQRIVKAVVDFDG
ncbi:MAG: alcohol dehydrogenase catalytic domain-containing protein [Vulcanimicrobiaceae bacterium]